jgi:HD-like signal output (HDOD) protein
MTDASGKSEDKLAEIFARINMSELPAMSVHVKELLSLSSGDRRSNYNLLSEIILRDFSLTNKVLQFANSAYYSHGNSVNTVSSAVAVLGFETIRELAVGIALFDDFVQAGVEKDEIGQLLTRSFLSALLARDIADSRDLQVETEEVFICALLHSLGRIIACIYLPAQYKEIAREIERGIDKNTAAEAVLDGVNFSELGQEVARFWNMTKNVIDSMNISPEKIKEVPEPQKNLLMIVDFSNRFVDSICDVREIDTLLEKYGYSLAVDEEEAVEMLEKGMDTSESIFSSIRSGLATLDLRNKLEKVLDLSVDERPEPDQEKKYQKVSEIEPDSPAIIELDDEKSGPRELNDYIRELTAMLLGKHSLESFFATMLDALYKGIGFCRVVIAMPVNINGKKKVVGRLARGDIDQPAKFSFVLGGKDIPSRCYNECKIMAVSGNTPSAFSDNLKILVRDRIVYLFPVAMHKKKNEDI